MSNYTGGVTNRRIKALSRLKEQLSHNESVIVRKAKGEDINPLTDGNIGKITKEIKTLQERI